MKNTISIGSVFVLLVFVSGCVSTNAGNFGKLKHDDQVKQTFESFTVPDGYDFYYYGSETKPKAFIGISKPFKLESSFWVPIKLTPEILRNWIWVHANRLKGDTRNFGSVIVGPDMEQIGVWYSLEAWDQWARIDVSDNEVVKIGTPQGSASRKFGQSSIRF